MAKQRHIMLKQEKFLDLKLGLCGRVLPWNLNEVTMSYASAGGGYRHGVYLSPRPNLDEAKCFCNLPLKNSGGIICP